MVLGFIQMVGLVQPCSDAIFIANKMGQYYTYGFIRHSFHMGINCLLGLYSWIGPFNSLGLSYWFVATN